MEGWQVAVNTGFIGWCGGRCQRLLAHILRDPMALILKSRLVLLHNGTNVTPAFEHGPWRVESRLVVSKARRRQTG
jgi:hypothetical protein